MHLKKMLQLIKEGNVHLDVFFSLVWIYAPSVSLLPMQHDSTDTRDDAAQQPCASRTLADVGGGLSSTVRIFMG
jgi:hypothetical protein